ncbi:MAG: AcvB/VirJ family lysyl-phosphatidylglycerol hydrolase [Stenotrophobium sp.]
MKRWTCMLLLLVSVCAQAQGIVTHGRFKRVVMVQPQGSPTGFVLLLSGDAGWNAGMTLMANTLAAQGALVAGIDTPALLRDLNRDDGDCVFPDGDLDNLSRFVQAYYKVPGYLPPLLAGYGTGATFAYAVLAQAPDHTFSGALMLGFSPRLRLKKPLCVDRGVKFTRLKHSKGVELLPVQRIKAPLVALQGTSNPANPASVAQAFFAQVPGAGVIVVPDVGHGLQATAQAQWAAAYRKLVSTEPKPVPPPASLGDLPLIEIAPQGVATNTFAVILSGDGGWAGLDKDVAAALSQKGIAIVGVDSLRYFWGARTPLGTAADIDRIVRYYAAHWNKKQVLLIGYSQGADVLPFIINRLSQDVLAKVSLAAGMGLSEHATFEFHMANWVKNDTVGPPTLPEIDKIQAVPFLCIYGADETDSACPKIIGTAHAHAVKLSGGHHFDGNYGLLAEQILKAVPR